MKLRPLLKSCRMKTLKKENVKLKLKNLDGYQKTRRKKPRILKRMNQRAKDVKRSDRRSMRPEDEEAQLVKAEAVTNSSRLVQGSVFTRKVSIRELWPSATSVTTQHPRATTSVTTRG